MKDRHEQLASQQQYEAQLKSQLVGDWDEEDWQAFLRQRPEGDEDFAR